MKTLLHITERADGVKPVESGIRATKKGFKKNKHFTMDITGVWKYKNNYTGLFFKNGTHMTWAYGKGPLFPEGVNEFDSGTVTVVGHYSDKEVSCLIVEFNGIKTQP